MRTAFFHTLAELAKVDQRIILLTADLGYLAIEPFADKFPDRFINVGVAEQNMVGMATGLAEAGFIPFTYSISPFSTLRPYEFIRNGPIAHQLPVRIIGVGGGVDYSTNGLTHYGLEDIGVMRTQPGISIIIPADAAQVRSALMATWNRSEPIFYRLGKGEQDQIPNLNGHFELGKVDILNSGDDLIIFSVGSITKEVLSARDILMDQGIFPMLVLISSLNFEYPQEIAELVSHYSLAISVEDHYVNNGLGSMISEIIAENNLMCQLIRCGFKTTPDGLTGSKKYIYQKNMLSANELANTITHAINKQHSKNSHRS